MAQRFNADTSIPDAMVVPTAAASQGYYSDAISLLGCTSVSITYYSSNGVAGTLNAQVTDFDTFNTTGGLSPTREQTFNNSGQSAVSISGPTVGTYTLASSLSGAKWLRLWFQCSTAGNFRAAITLKANVAS